MIKVRIYLKSVENVITLDKLIGLLFLFCHTLLSILLLKNKRNDLARSPCNGNHFSSIYIYMDTIVDHFTPLTLRVRGNNRYHTVRVSSFLVFLEFSKTKYRGGTEQKQLTYKFTQGYNPNLYHTQYQHINQRVR